MTATKCSYKKRHGALGFKLGMTRMYVNDKLLAVTAIDLSNCKVVSHMTEEKNGYTAVQVGVGNSKNINKPQLEMFKKLACEPVKHLHEFRINTLEGALNAGDTIGAEYFESEKALFVDVTGVSKGKGFAGGMKRWNFDGLRATHGVSLTHRSIGGTGFRRREGRVFPGKKMPGRLGGDQTTSKTLKVVGVNKEHNVIFVHGSVPGSKGDCVIIRDAVLG